MVELLQEIKFTVDFVQKHENFGITVAVVSGSETTPILNLRYQLSLRIVTYLKTD